MYLSFRQLSLLMAMIVTLFVASTRSDAVIHEYYIGRDLRQTIPSGTYSGLDNPNFNRLTLLFAHPDDVTPANNHYHAKSPYTYFGPNLGGLTTVQPYNGAADGTPGNYLPEGAAAPPLQLLPGAGAFSGKIITGLVPGEEYGELSLHSVDALAGFPVGSGEYVMHNSGGNTPTGRWAGSMAGSILRLHLVSISPGLEVMDAAGNTLLDSAGDSWLLGSGGSSLNFPFVLGMDDSVTSGSYSAVFKLSDSGTGNSGGPWLESGLFQVNVGVPEPGALSMILLAGAALLRRRA
jgi:hypothetical protein